MINLLIRLYFWGDRLRLWRQRRFTPAGLFALGVLAAAAMVGFNTRLAMSYQILALVAGLVIVALISSRKFRGRFEMQRTLPRYASVDQPLRYRITLENRGTSEQKALTVYDNAAITPPSREEFLAAPEPDGAATHPFDRFTGYKRWRALMTFKRGAQFKPKKISRLRAGEKQHLPFSILPMRRGRLQMSGLTIARPDPLGLCRARQHRPLPQSVLILPKRYRLPDINLPGGRQHHSGGMALAQSVGDAEEFISLRDYRPGDPLRRIHWRSFAKQDKPIVKEYQEEFFVRHMLFLDTFGARSQDPVFEEAVSVAASFACSVTDRESLLDLIFVGPRVFCFTAGRGVGRTDRILEVLAAVQPCNDDSFDTLFPEIVARAPLLSGCICILLAWDRKRRQLVRLLESFGLPLLLLLVVDAAVKKKFEELSTELLPANLHLLEAGAIEAGLQKL